MQQLIKSIKKEKSTADLTRFTFSMDDLDKIEWFKYGREFRHNDEMYDIVTAEQTKDGGVIYYCIRDVKEKEIYANAGKHVGHSGQGKQHSGLVLRYLNFLSSLFFQQTTPACDDLICAFRERAFYINLYHSIHLFIPCEPPDFA